MDMEIDKKKYADYIKAITPVHNLWISMGKAFITGGLICTLGQFIMNWATDRCGLEAKPVIGTKAPAPPNFTSFW